MLGKHKDNKVFHFKAVSQEELLQKCWKQSREKVVAQIKKRNEEIGVVDIPSEAWENDSDLEDGGKRHFWYLHQALEAEWKEASGKDYHVGERQASEEGGHYAHCIGWIYRACMARRKLREISSCRGRKAPAILANSLLMCMERSS